MRPGFNRRLFLLGTPGTEGWENIRPFRPGVIRAGRAYPAGSRLRETLTFCCEKEEAVSPGDGLFPPDETAFETPRYLIRSVTAYPDHLEAEAEAAAGRRESEEWPLPSVAVAAAPGPPLSEE